jgi:hypothetical protein
MGAAVFTVLIAAASHDAAAQDTQCGDTALKEFEKQIKQAELAIPKNPMGRWVNVGECTKRAVQRGITMASPKTNADAVDAENKVDCLRLAKFERTRACACAKIGDQRRWNIRREIAGMARLGRVAQRWVFGAQSRILLS